MQGIPYRTLETGEGGRYVEFISVDYMKVQKLEEFRKLIWRLFANFLGNSLLTEPFSILFRFSGDTWWAIQIFHTVDTCYNTQSRCTFGIWNELWGAKLL